MGKYSICISALFIFAFIEAIFLPGSCRHSTDCTSIWDSDLKHLHMLYLLHLVLFPVLLVGYLAGHFLWVNAAGEFTWFANLFFNNIPGFSIDLFNNIKGLYAQWDFWIVFTAGFTPVPYKIFTVTAGVFDMNLPAVSYCLTNKPGCKVLSCNFPLMEIWKAYPAIL